MNDTISAPIQWGIGNLNSAKWSSHAFATASHIECNSAPDRFEIEGTTFVMSALACAEDVFNALETES